MALQNIPCQTNGLPYFQLGVDLDGATYQLEFRWNERSAAWYMAVYDASSVRQIAGVRVVVGYPLAAETRYNTELPPGIFIALDTSGTDTDPTLYDLGTRVQLFYRPANG